MNKRKSVIMICVLMLLLAVGFAAVATNLILNGETTIGVNQKDFDVYFSKAKGEAYSTATISEDKKTISYNTKVLKNVGDIAKLKYTITNDSANYDAKVTVSFTANDTVSGKDYSDYYSIVRTGFDTTTETLLEGKTSKDGTIVISLEKPVLEDVSITFTMTFDCSAQERTEKAVQAINDTKGYEIVSGDLDTVGSVVKINNEEFYVIGQEDDTHVKLLTKYNLNSGDHPYQEDEKGIQSPNAKRFTEEIVYTQYGSSVFADTNYWAENNNTLKSQYAKDSMIAEPYDENSSLYPYIYDYVSYLEDYNVSVSGRLLTMDDLNGLGCEVARFNCTNAPSWLLDNETWLNIAQADGNIMAINEGRLMFFNYYAEYQIGIRPVIILEK
ncbi:MAG: hypothetical protein K6C11_02655 [Bacilli bacterium]|nr:hypothetical protein [Bacilli bacterium]